MLWEHISKIRISLILIEIRPSLWARLAPGSQVPVAMSWAKSAEKHVKFPQTASSSRSSPSNPIPARSGGNSAFTPHGLPPKRPFRNQERSQAMHVTFSQVEGTSSMTWSLPPWSHQAACWICGFPGPARWGVRPARVETLHPGMWTVRKLTQWPTSEPKKGTRLAHPAEVRLQSLDFLQEKGLTHRCRPWASSCPKTPCVHPQSNSDVVICGSWELAADCQRLQLVQIMWVCLKKRAPLNPLINHQILPVSPLKLP